MTNDSLVAGEQITVRLAQGHTLVVQGPACASVSKRIGSALIRGEVGGSFVVGPFTEDAMVDLSSVGSDEQLQASRVTWRLLPNSTPG